MDRNQQICRLSDEEFDVIVIGGGITGACVAYDAAKRGLRVALLEKSDFGGATSSASSKILHGGIRYLQQARPDKVRESAFERMYFQNLVPHLCEHVAFMIPSYAGLTRGRAALFAASLAYYGATFGQNKVLTDTRVAIQPAYMINRREVGKRVPWLRRNTDITGALVLPECRLKSTERVTWSFVQGAAIHGAAVANYVPAEGLVYDGQTVTGVSARDSIGGTTFQIRGKVVANCGGPWIGSLEPKKSRTGNCPITAFSRGAHILMKGDSLKCAIALPTSQKIEGVAGRGGRHMFMIPWRGHTLVGTSYAPHSHSLDRVAPTEEDIEQLRIGINTAIGYEVISYSKIVHAYAGIYPLIARDVRNSVYQGTGDYQIMDHGMLDSIAGLISVFGAKFTTARILAEKACDLIVRKVGKDVRRCATRHSPVPTADFGDLGDYLSNVKDKYFTVTDRDNIERLVMSFGNHASGVLDLINRNSELGHPLGKSRPNLAAEVVFCARNEMLVHLDDFVFRRSGVGTIGNPGSEVLRACVDLLGEELGWSEARRIAEIDRTMVKFRLPRCDE